MSDWQDIGYGLEAKVTENHSVWIRNQGQKSEYPYLTIDIDSQGNVIGFRSSDPRSLCSIEARFWLVTLVKEKLLRPDRKFVGIEPR